MPPKGWRKNPDGSYPQPNRATEIKLIDEILFPKLTVLKLAKEVLPEGTLISKDSAAAMQRSATVYVNYIMEYARNVTTAKERSTVTAQDVMEAFYNVGLEEFIEPLRKELDEFTKLQEEKKASRLKRKAENVDAEAADENKEKKENEDVEMAERDDEEEEEQAGDDDDDDNDDDDDDDEDDGVETGDEEDGTISNSGNRNLTSLEKEQKELEGEEPKEDINGKGDDDDEDEDEEDGKAGSSGDERSD